MNFLNLDSMDCVSFAATPISTVWWAAKDNSRENAEKDEFFRLPING